MKFWLVQDTASVSAARDSRKIAIRSRRRARIEAGDRIVLLLRPNLFSSTAKVQEVTSKPEIDDESLVVTQVLVDEWQEIIGKSQLDALVFSLTLIKNFERPSLHFRRGYRRLPEEDFHTIERGEPFLARTTFFELYRALPRPTQRAFEAEEALGGEFPRRRRTYADRATQLWRFIKRHVMGLGEQLIELEETIEKLEIPRGEGVVLEHRIADEDSTATDSIVAQANAFRALNEALKPDQGKFPAHDTSSRDLVETILVVTQEPDRASVENRFERIFGDLQ